MAFRTDRYYSICDKHRAKIEASKKINGEFSKHDGTEVCEWNLGMSIKDRCKEPAEFDFVRRI